MCWLTVGIKMKRAGFNLSTFIAFSNLDSKRFNEEACIKKWNSFDKYEPDYGPMKYYMKKKGLCKSSATSHLEILKQNMITEIYPLPYNVHIAQDFKKLYSDIVKFSNGNFYVCVDGKWKIDEHNVHITHVITDLYFDDLTRDLCYLKAC